MGKKNQVKVQVDNSMNPQIKEQDWKFIELDRIFVPTSVRLKLPNLNLMFTI